MRCKRLQMIPPGLPHVRIMCTVLELSLVGCLTWWLTTVWFECCPSSMYYHCFCVLDSGCEGSLWSSDWWFFDYLTVTTCTYIDITWTGPGYSLNPERWQFTLKTHLKTIFYCFSKDIWILKSGCSLKSPTHGIMCSVLELSLVGCPTW